MSQRKGREACAGQRRTRAHSRRVIPTVPRSRHQDELIAEYLRRFDPDATLGVLDRTDLTPRERLLAVFDIHAPLCPFIGAAVEIADPEHPARVRAREYKQSVADRLAETAREAGATDPEQLGEQLALLLDGASARIRTLNPETLPTAAALATTLIELALPKTSARTRPGKWRGSASATAATTAP